MKLMFRTPKIVDVFLDDDVTEKHGFGRWSKFCIQGERLILLAGNALSDSDFKELKSTLKGMK